MGKTTITANLGVCLASYGEKVLLIDADFSMANLELILGLEGKSVTLNDVLSGEADIQDAIYDGPGGTKVIPAGISLDTLRKVKLKRFKKTLETLALEADIILIDAPAGLEKDALTAIAAGQEMILVTTREVPSISDAIKTKIVAIKLGLDIIGVVINRKQYDETFLTEREIETILEIPVLANIPEDPGVSRAAAFSEPFVLKNQNSPVYNAIMQLGADIVGKEFQPIKPDKGGIVTKLLDGLLGKR